MRLPSGRWRAQVYDQASGKNLSVSRVLGGPGTFKTKTEAKQARQRARERLGRACVRDVTVQGFWERWTTDPLFARPKEASDIRRREATKAFVERHGDVPIAHVGDEIVAAWLAGGRCSGSVQALCYDIALHHAPRLGTRPDKASSDATIGTRRPRNRPQPQESPAPEPITINRPDFRLGLPP
jgi:hypothetical protein